MKKIWLILICAAMITMTAACGSKSPADDSAGIAHHGTVIRYIFQYDGARTNLDMVSDRNRAEDFRACANRDMIADRGMAFSGIFTGTAKRHALVERDIVTDNRGFADHDTAAVVDEKAMPDLGAGVDFDAGFPSCALREQARIEKVSVLIGFMGAAVTEYRLEARIAEQDFEPAVYCRVSAQYCINFFFQIFEHGITEFLLPEFPDTSGLPAGCSVPGHS